MALLIRNADSASEFSVVFDDDGRVAYAYLLDGDQIVSDVWVYNVCATPDVPEWHDPERMPFANPKGFVSDVAFQPVRDDSEIMFGWAAPSVEVFIRGEIAARLKAGSKPGEAVLALRDGPLARVLR